jgi:glycosyltransferase involved in cell wall biosynthesis
MGGYDEAPAGSIPVYFLQRRFHRQRQRDTVEHLPAPFRAVAPAEVGAVADFEANARGARSLARRLAAGAVRGPAPLNVAVVRDPAARSCELLYTWGKLPLWPRRPYVVELDNPYVLTLYDVDAHRRLGAVLRRALLGRRCAGIVCISEACRRTTEVTLGPAVAERARVVYPFVARGPLAAPGEREGPLELLFVGTQFFLKGGREVCGAVARLAADGVAVRLTVVSNVPDEVRARFADAPIRFLEANLPRERIVGELLPSSDVFVLPTMMESFGMAVLEAVAAGLPVVTTDIYALRELVEDGANGVLLDDPVGLWRGDEARPELLGIDFEAYVRERDYPGLAAALAQTLRALADDRARVRAMAAASRAAFDERFAPERRAAALAGALGEFHRAVAPADVAASC